MLFQHNYTKKMPDTIEDYELVKLAKKRLHEKPQTIRVKRIQRME